MTFEKSFVPSKIELNALQNGFIISDSHHILIGDLPSNYENIKFYQNNQRNLERPPIEQKIENCEYLEVK